MEEDEKTFLNFMMNDIFNLEMSVADYLQRKLNRQEFFKIMAGKVFELAMNIIKYHQTYVDKTGH